MPDDIEWAGIDDFRCTYNIAVPMPCNWKTLIDGFSETYHVQGIHREMLPMVDDVNSPQRLWDHHGKLEQPYGLPSPRLRDGADDQAVWEAFIAVMGTRIGKPTVDDAGPARRGARGQRPARGAGGHGARRRHRTGARLLAVHRRRSS